MKSVRITCALRRRRESKASSRDLSGCDDSLMANVFGGGGVNRVLGNVSGMIADAFKVPGDEH